MEKETTIMSAEKEKEHQIAHGKRTYLKRNKCVSGNMVLANTS